MYPLAEGTQRFDENGKEIFTFPGQDNKGHRKAQTKFSCTRFGADVFLKTKASKVHKQWVSYAYKNLIVPINTSNSGLTVFAA